MKIASILENQKIEKRIAITPEIAKKYISLGLEVLLAENYGSHLGIKDEEYKELGVSISKDEKEIISSADIIVQLGLLDDDKSSLLKENQTFIGVLNPYDNKDKINDLVKKNINTFSLELLPRITRAQSMDILSSQANLAGYKAVVESFAHFEKAIPMMMTAAGTIPAAKVLVVCAGVAGLQAIATAKRMGAIVFATDVRMASKEQVESLGGKFLTVEGAENLETEGGYAKEASDDFKKKQEELLSQIRFGITNNETDIKQSELSNIDPKYAPRVSAEERAEELGIEDNSEGIAIIDEDIALNHKLGTSGAELLNLNDYIYDLAITANRPDGMSVVGIAREISALLETKLNFPDLKNKYKTNVYKNFNLCPEAITKNCLYSISNIESVNGKQLSPGWLKDRLAKSGIKSINLLVDITNYILLEQGQPLHAFDKDKLSNLIGRKVSYNDFSVRKAYNNENLLCLNGENYKLNENITIIACDDKPVAIAGVIGGLETAVNEDTSSIYLEGAVFNPVTIRKSSKEIGIRTESSSRYEKGISYKNTLDSVTRAINILEEYFNVLNPIINTSKELDFTKILIPLRRERINKILGPIVIRDENYDTNSELEKRYLSDNEISEKLKLIGCTLNIKEYGWDVEIISNRSQDLLREIDLIEEIARLIGYDMFDLNLPNPIKPGKLSSSQIALRKLKTGLIVNGFNEVLSYSLVPESKNNLIKISNPLLLETSCLRDNIWQEHIKICNQNIMYLVK